MNQSDPMEIARVGIKKALAPDYLGEYSSKKEDEEILAAAINRVMDNIGRLISTNSAPRNKLGATVMTETAAQRTGKDGLPGIRPRSL